MDDTGQGFTPVHLRDSERPGSCLLPAAVRSRDLGSRPGTASRACRGGPARQLLLLSPQGDCGLTRAPAHPCSDGWATLLVRSCPSPSTHAARGSRSSRQHGDHSEHSPHRQGSLGSSVTAEVQSPDTRKCEDTMSTLLPDGCGAWHQNRAGAGRPRAHPLGSGLPAPACPLRLPCSLLCSSSSRSLHPPS